VRLEVGFGPRSSKVYRRLDVVLEQGTGWKGDLETNQKQLTGVILNTVAAGCTILPTS